MPGDSADLPNVVVEDSLMFESATTMLLTVATIGAGLMAGVYFAFSGFIMRSLDLLGAVHAANAMNTINQIILRSWFMVVFFGSTLLYTILISLALFDTNLPGRYLLLAIGMIYVSGMFLCTVFFNVPLNNRLAEANGDDIAKLKIWPHYLKHWTRWNHLRSVCSLVATLLGIHYLASDSWGNRF